MQNKNTADMRYVITRYEGGVLSFHQKKQQLQSISYYPAQNTESVGDIFVAKIIHIVPNLKAAFLYYQPGKKGFLPLEEAQHPLLLNRAYDGRLLAGDELLVQLNKEAIRTKEPVFTCNLSLSGKYCVVTNSNTRKGVSHKIGKAQREELLAALPAEALYGIVIRTNAQELLEQGTLAVLTEECTQLLARMHELVTKGIHRTCYQILYQAPAPYLTELRDSYEQAYDLIVTDDPEIHAQLTQFVAQYLPQYTSCVQLYEDAEYSLHKLYRIDTVLQELTGKKVWLKSGAYLVIEQTEAMYVIDVNSGKNIAKKTDDDYMMSINLEAAAEIMRQLKLRNLSGMILVDFINLSSSELQQKLLQELRQLARQDRILTTVVDMTPLGLVEITRKKGKKSLKDQLYFGKSLDFSKVE